MGKEPEPTPCMDDEEQRLWREANRSMTKDTRARIPCEDCMFDFAMSMAMQGRCIRFKFGKLELEVAEDAE